MRLFEILMLLTILPVLAWPLLPGDGRDGSIFLPVTAVILLLFQLIIEGYRWQMLPAYALVIGLFLGTLPRLWRPRASAKKRSGWAMTGSVVGLLVWLAALALPYALPVPKLPDVTGPYAIGTQTFHLVDDSRDEIYTDDPADKREFMMQIWYPTTPDAKGNGGLPGRPGRDGACVGRTAQSALVFARPHQPD
ncbi:MAG: hypothetical protein M5U34_30130 [Chloroflexi bacterium]|nr:hypothetical protein [Chloroflexota bacterium]